MSLQKHLKELLGADLDIEVYDYIEGVIREYDGSGLSIEDVRDTLCGFSDVFSQLPEEEQDAAVISLLQHQDAPPTSSSGAPSDIDTKIAIQSTSGQGKVDGTQTGPSVETRPIEEQLPLLPPLLADQCREEVTLLASLCPISVPEDYLADVFLNQSNKDLQTAANKILEQGPEVLQAEIISWEAASTNQGAIAAANTTTTSGRGRTMTGDSPLKPDEELRRSIVARFHLEAIPSGGGGDGKKGGKSDKLAAWGMQNSGSGASQNNGGQKLRYRDGVVVATKGEKFIVEKEPEWDGGSRGRVKSKRKGGVGWQ